jgi:PIN domain nuclease of toxin-antitoxin system
VLGVQRGRIASPISAEATARAWLEASPIEVVPIEKEIAILSRTLVFEHEDPADRFIGATAFHLDCQLVTVDARLSGLPWLRVLPSTAG